MEKALYAVTEKNSRGREYEERDDSSRNDFQRDYTRIIHTEAFRRMQHKTQVFGAMTGDIFRTRLTHSIEVEQLARSVARSLGLNEDLAGVLAVSHDIGHAPFGHTGQDVLEELMKDHGGFEHNWQAVRIVTKLEGPYLEHPGLNLMFETREGLLKHCSKERAGILGDLAIRHIEGKSPPLEAQLVDWCDAISYVHADLEDAFFMGVISFQKMSEAPGFTAAHDRIKMAGVDGVKYEMVEGGDACREEIVNNKKVVKSILREMRRVAMEDLISSSRGRIARAKVKSLDDVRNASPLIGFSEQFLAEHKKLKRFSREFIYNHTSVRTARVRQESALRDLFATYLENPEEMSGVGMDCGEGVYRSVADHIAGMTDRYALSEHARLLKTPSGLKKNATLSRTAKPN